MKLAYENIGIFLIILSFRTASLPPFFYAFYAVWASIISDSFVFILHIFSALNVHTHIYAQIKLHIHSTIYT